MKLKAATLMESLVAMVIILIGLGIGAMVYVNVLQSDREYSRFKTMLFLKKKAQELEQTKLFLDGQEVFNGNQVDVRFIADPEGSGLLEMHLKMTDTEGRVLGTFDQLVEE